nr:DUF4386 domain-containing protein [Nonomuraea turkmeniaca]
MSEEGDRPDRCRSPPEVVPADTARRPNGNPHPRDTAPPPCAGRRPVVPHQHHHRRRRPGAHPAQTRRAGDPVATAANITASPWMLHLAVAGDLVTSLCEVALPALFYVLLKPVDRTLALVMAMFRLAFTAMVITNVLNLYGPLRLLADEPYLTPLSEAQRAALAMLSLDAYHDGFTIALLFFAGHILLLGILLYRSRYVPRLLGVWLALGGCADMRGEPWHRSSDTLGPWQG